MTSTVCDEHRLSKADISWCQKRSHVMGIFHLGEEILAYENEAIHDTIKPIDAGMKRQLFSRDGVTKFNTIEKHEELYSSKCLLTGIC